MNYEKKYYLYLFIPEISFIFRIIFSKSHTLRSSFPRFSEIDGRHTG